MCYATRLKIVILFALAMAGAGAFSMAIADPLTSTDADSVLRDPSPKDSHDFTLRSATAGIADPGHSESYVKTDLVCSPESPCAESPPPLSGSEMLTSHSATSRR